MFPPLMENQGFPTKVNMKKEDSKEDMHSENMHSEVNKFRR